MPCGHDSVGPDDRPGDASIVTRVERGGVTLLEGSRGSVRYAFTERTGGVSEPPFSSLNLASHVGDDPRAVAENRRRLLSAFGVADAAARLLVPNQIHSDIVVTVSSVDQPELERVRDQIARGADAIVCTASRVPVMLCFADCVPVVLTAPGGFAVVHSGWRGTYARIAGKAVAALCDATGSSPDDVQAVIGPHILGEEYKVSPDLFHKFSLQFGNIENRMHNALDLSAAIRQTLEEIGVRSCEIHDTRLSTLRLPERFFSYRGEGGACGRHAAIAVLD